MNAPIKKVVIALIAIGMILGNQQLKYGSKAESNPEQYLDVDLTQSQTTTSFGRSAILYFTVTNIRLEKTDLFVAFKSNIPIFLTLNGFNQYSVNNSLLFIPMREMHPSEQRKLFAAIDLSVATSDLMGISFEFYIYVYDSTKATLFDQTSQIITFIRPLETPWDSNNMSTSRDNKLYAIRRSAFQAELHYYESGLGNYSLQATTNVNVSLTDTNLNEFEKHGFVYYLRKPTLTSYFTGVIPIQMKYDLFALCTYVAVKFTISLIRDDQTVSTITIILETSVSAFKNRAPSYTAEYTPPVLIVFSSIPLSSVLVVITSENQTLIFVKQSEQLNSTTNSFILQTNETKTDLSFSYSFEINHNLLYRIKLTLKEHIENNDVSEPSTIWRASVIVPLAFTLVVFAAISAFTYRKLR